MRTLPDHEPARFDSSAAATDPAAASAPDRISAWERARSRETVGVMLLLVITAGLELVGLGAKGWGNVFYAAAAQAGAQSPVAAFFGASDAPASITVDKPPASLWLMDASVRLFGLSPASVLLPEALLGVVTVALIWAAVRRVASANTALLAGSVMALTPIATLVFHYDNPDALLTALIALAGYGSVRAAEHGRLRWLALVGAAFGFAFLTKQLQAFITLPAFVLLHVIGAPRRLSVRLGQIAFALGCLVVSAGWWVAAVELTPASMRPYVGGSTTNSFLQLTFGYNGVGRIMGGTGNGGNRAIGLARFAWGPTAVGASWLLPAAVILGITALILLRRIARVERAAQVAGTVRRAGTVSRRTTLRRAVLLSSGLTVGIGVVGYSLMQGIYHSYYSAVIVPALSIVFALSAEVVWSFRSRPWVRVVLAITAGLSTAWSVFLLWQGPTSLLPVAVVVGIIGAGVTIAIAVPRMFGRVGRGHTDHVGERRAATIARRHRTIAALAVAAALLGPASVSVVTAGDYHSGPGPTVAFPSRQVGRTDPAVVALLNESHGCEWAAATTGSTTAGAYQLATGQPVMPVGGYTHADPTPTLPQFKDRIAQHRVHWYIGSLGPIGHWVAAHYPALTVGHTVVYDLSGPMK